MLGSDEPGDRWAGEAVHVRVPATSANLGPAFDSVGLALSRYDEVLAQLTGDSQLQVQVYGQGAASVPRDESNLVVRTIREGLAAFDESGELAGRGLRVACRNQVPHGRGMGSSAAAIVGGLLVAAHLAQVADQVGPDALLAMANHIEGHPDNVAAAVLGGATISWGVAGPSDVGVVGRGVRFAVRPEVVPVLVIPEQTAGTSKARAALPTSVPHADAAFNCARSALLVHALGSDPSLLLEATDDRLHQRQRASVYPESLQLVDSLRARGIPAAISGAGPSVIAFAVDGSGTELSARIAGWVGRRANVVALPVSSLGAHPVGDTPSHLARSAG